MFRAWGFRGLGVWLQGLDKLVTQASKQAPRSLWWFPKKKQVPCFGSLDSSICGSVYGGFRRKNKGLPLEAWTLVNVGLYWDPPICGNPSLSSIRFSTLVRSSS